MAFRTARLPALDSNRKVAPLPAVLVSQGSGMFTLATFVFFRIALPFGSNPK